MSEYVFLMILIGIWLVAALMAFFYSRKADQLMRSREDREQKGLLIEVGVVLVLNGEALTVYKIEGKRIYTTTATYTERVQ